jgi:hypothetical protein
MVPARSSRPCSPMMCRRSPAPGRGRGLMSYSHNRPSRAGVAAGAIISMLWDEHQRRGERGHAAAELPHRNHGLVPRQPAPVGEALLCPRGLCPVRRRLSDLLDGLAVLLDRWAR